MSKSVVFNSWPGAFFHPGGGEMQLLETKAALEAKGFAIDLYNQWQPQVEFEIYHQFSTEPGTSSVLRGFKGNDKKIAISPIMWGYPPKDHFIWHDIKQAFDLADILFPNSMAEAERLAEAFDVPLEKFHKTRNAIPDAYRSLETGADFRAAYGIEGDFLLSVANIDNRKNTERLVAVCKALGVQLVSVGHIREVPYYERFKDSYNGFKQVGPITDVAMLKSAYQQCLSYVLPSLCETPGIAALEAASQGANVIITSEGATEEYFGEYATYVDPLSEASIKSALMGAGPCANPKKQIDFIVGEYTWDKCADDVMAGYLKCGDV